MRATAASAHIVYILGTDNKLWRGKGGGDLVDQNVRAFQVALLSTQTTGPSQCCSYLIDCSEVGQPKRYCQVTSCPCPYPQ